MWFWFRMYYKLWHWISISENQGVSVAAFRLSGLKHTVATNPLDFALKTASGIQTKPLHFKRTQLTATCNLKTTHNPSEYTPHFFYGQIFKNTFFLGRVRVSHSGGMQGGVMKRKWHKLSIWNWICHASACLGFRPRELMSYCDRARSVTAEVGHKVWGGKVGDGGWMMKQRWRRAEGR